MDLNCASSRCLRPPGSACVLSLIHDIPPYIDRGCACVVAGIDGTVLSRPMSRKLFHVSRTKLACPIRYRCCNALSTPECICPRYASLHWASTKSSSSYHRLRKGLVEIGRASCRERV